MTTMNLTSLNLTEIEEDLTDITELYCGYNDLKSLPRLPEGLELLDCQNNQITELPDLPESLVELNCNGNKLKKLPKLPKGLLVLKCSGNQLTSLPEIPRYIETLEYDNNNFPENYIFLLPWENYYDGQIIENYNRLLKNIGQPQVGTLPDKETYYKNYNLYKARNRIGDLAMSLSSLGLPPHVTAEIMDLEIGGSGYAVASIAGLLYELNKDKSLKVDVGQNRTFRKYPQLATQEQFEENMKRMYERAGRSYKIL